MILLRRCPSPACRLPAGRRSCARTKASASCPASNSSKARRDQNGPSGRISRQFQRDMNAMECFLQRRETASAQNFRADPFGQRGELLQGHRDSAPQRAQRQALGEGIDGIDAREFRQPRLIDHTIGMHDLQACRRTTARCRTRSACFRPEAAFRRSPAGRESKSARHPRCRRWHRPDAARASVPGGAGRCRSTVTSSVTMVPGTASRILGRALRSMTLAGR